MSSPLRRLAADALVALALFLLALWVLRRIIGMLLWLSGLVSIVVVVGALLLLARVTRGRD